MKIFETNEELIIKAKYIADKYSKQILKDAGIEENNDQYKIRLYYLNYVIYRELKQILDIVI